MTAVLDVSLSEELLGEQPIPNVDADKPVYECPRCGRSSKTPAGHASHVRNCKATEGPDGAQAVGPAEFKPSITPKQKKPNLPARGRQDASSLLGFIYGTASNFMPSVPAQRAMAWQAPTAGRVLDDAVAGTFLDKQIIQKIAGASNKIEPVFNLLALPMIVMAMDRQPALGQMLYPIARRVVEGNLVAVVQQMKRETELRSSIEADARSVGLEWESEVLNPETGETVRVDIIDSILSKMFERPAEEPAPV